MDGHFPRRRVLGHHKNHGLSIWAARLSAGEFADRHSRFFSKREVLTGPELNRRDPLRTVNTPVSIKGIDEGAHATVLNLLRPLRRGVKAAKNSLISGILYPEFPLNSQPCDAGEP